MSMNNYGVKDANDCHRTIKGVRYIAWMSFPSAGRIAAYLAAGVRCRRFGEELFVHPMDEEEARIVDVTYERAAMAKLQSGAA